MTHGTWTRQHLLFLALATSAAWFVVYLVLQLLATAMVAITRYVTRPPVMPSTRLDDGRHAILSRLYTVLMFSCCAYYYLSVPLVLSAATGAVGGPIYAAVRVGRHPLALIALLAAFVGLFVAFKTFAAVLSGLFAGLGDGPPGRRLEMADHPHLREVLDDVAARVGTRPVDAVYLVPSVDVGITQQGRLVAQLRGAGERCLILGLALLDGLELRNFKAVLAHEYGHFLNHRCVDDGIALIVERSIEKTAARLSFDCMHAWWNPAWIFVTCLRRLLKNVRRGESRVSELRADRVAATAYGTDAVSLALRHTIAASVRFEEQANSSVRRSLRTRRPVVNLYRSDPETPMDDKRLATRILERLARHGRNRDEHSCTLDRLRFASVVGTRSAPSSGDGEPAWSLFADREQCERDVTADFQATVEAWLGPE